jgi:hypothetical protein
MHLSLVRLTILGGLLLFTASNAASASQPAPEFIRDGTAGFVVEHIEYALATQIADRTVCPTGYTPAPRTVAGNNPALLSRGGLPACANPQSAGPDPNFRVVSGRDARGYGIDLDQRRSRASDGEPGVCPHDDFIGTHGEQGIDNQFYRAVGCLQGYQANALGNSFATEMLSGSWGILIAVSGIDDYRNDAQVDVGFFANADPIMLSPSRQALAYATYAIHSDPQFQARTQGRIVDGVLTTEPVDMRFRKVTNSMYLDRPLLDAVAQLSLGMDGKLEGYLAGYTPVVAMYDLEFAFRDARNGQGEPASPRLIALSSRGRSLNLHYTCNGIYHALDRLADGHPDRATGKCTSISTQYRVRAIPAFVVEAQTQSLNEKLVR